MPSSTPRRPGAIVVFALLAGCSAGNPVSTPSGDLDPLRSLAIDLSAPASYTAAPPRHYGPAAASDNTPAGSPVTDEGATLGRVLFHDVELSVDRSVSCASCHVQSLGFTDDRVRSRGFDGGETGAHSMRLANARYYAGEEMFWDRRADDLDDQVLQPVLDEVEMGFDAEAGGIDALLARLESLEYYPVLFEWAFGSPGITEARIRSALAQYVRSMVSTGSRFDSALEAAPPGPPPAALSGFSDEENLGFRLFTLPPQQGGVGCAGCHELPTLALDPASGSNGLDAGETTVFKAPSLKNVGVTGPYMHDGRFATLSEVIDHYDHGVVDGPALDRRLRARGGGPVRLGLSDTEKAALVAFLHTLTDTALLTDERFSSPFR